MEIHLTNATFVILFSTLLFFAFWYLYFHYKFKEVREKVLDNFRISEEKQKQLTRLEILHGEVVDAMDNQKNLLDGILSSSLDGYWDWKIKEGYEYMSPRFKSMLGYKPEEMENIPDSWMKLIHPHDLSFALEQFGEHVKSKGLIPYSQIVRYTHKEGHIVWILCRGSVVEWDEDGNPIRAIGSHTDVTKAILSDPEEISKRRKEEYGQS